MGLLSLVNVKTEGATACSNGLLGVQVKDR